MNLIVRIPDEHADRVGSADPARLEQVALQAVLQAAAEPGIGSAGDQAGRGAARETQHAAGQALATEFRQLRRGQTLGGLRVGELVAAGRR